MPVLKYTTDVSQAVAEVNKLNDAAGRKTQEAIRGTARESQNLSSLQKKLLRETTTIQEDYNKKLLALEGLYKKGQIGADRYRDSVKKVTEEYFAQKRGAEDIDKSNDKAFGSDAVKRLASYAAGFFSVSTAIRLVNSELQAQQMLIDKAEDTKMGVSQARNVLRRNLLSLPAAERERIVSMFGKIAGESLISETPVMLAAAEAVSASGGNIPASLAATSLSARVFKDQPSQIGLIAGSLLDLAKVTGTNDAQRNFGLLLQVGALSRVVDPQAQAMNIAPGLIGASAFGGTARGSGALFSALTTGSGDIRGAQTATSIIQLARQLSEFAPTAELPTLTERIQALQTNRALAEQFLEDASFEAKSLGPIRKLLLDSQSEVSKAFAENLGKFSPEVLDAMAKRALSAIDADKIGESAVRRRALESTVEGLRLEAPGALTQTERDLVKEILQRAGTTALGATAADFMAALGGGGEVTLEDAIEQLRRQRERLGGTKKIPSMLAPGGFIELPMGTETDKQALTEAIKKLEEVQKQQLEQQKITNQKLSEGGLVGVAE